MYPWHMRTNVLTRGVSVLLAASACATGCGSTVDPASGPDGGGGGADGATDAPAEASDGATCDEAAKASLCCCDGDLAADLTCAAGEWACPSGFGRFSGGQCNGLACGGPCSLPCPLDAGDDGPVGPAALCTSTGGTLATATCCQATGDFPDLCSVGACGCPPQSSHSVAVCACAVGCFDPAVGCRVP